MLNDKAIYEHGYTRNIINDKLCFVEKLENKHNFLDEILYGLQCKYKFISPKFFYDDIGQKLFNKICETKEYYLTRIETQILSNLKNVNKHIDKNFQLIEFGSGDSLKTEMIIDIFKTQKHIDYFPIDVSNIIKTIHTKLQNKYSNLYITPIVSDYDDAFKLINTNDQNCKFLFFLGSSFGNFNTTNAKNFLEKIKKIMNKCDLFLLGLDLVKDQKTLLNAYNDSTNFTANFNLNILTNINKLTGANFDVNKFEHEAIYNTNKRRIEIYLRSTTNQKIIINNTIITFNENELINTEYSYKYTIDEIKYLITSLGLKIKNIYHDKYKQYSLILISN